MAAAKVEAAKESLPLNEAIKVLRSTEVAYPNTAYHLFVKTQVGNGVAVPKGRITWPRDAKPKAEETIVVFAEGKQAGDAKRAGATKVGGMELVEDILNSKVRPTTVLCTSALIKPITPKLGRFLGPMGLMPSTRRGTVTDDVGGYIRRLQGSSEWRADKTGNIRTTVAMMHFPANDVVKNFRHFIQSLKEATGHVADKSSSARRNKAASPKPVTPILRVLLGSKHGPTIRISDAL
ncbi:ribosomal protein L1 [Fistulina hepatica ATCC 64428]|uniref:Ribosomal protein L1 n=1 Tax=Fistulina hepatica ATCC 64428 TaxID=1128425 RepID=A0A0D7A7K4_9AGAR|nr:ribosomal protein L1 [Fistulina hepatica ATCC 64428]